VLSEDVGVMSMYYFPQPNVVRAGITGAVPSNPFGSPTWQIYQWEAA
jgi:hypothetical protein